MWKTEYAPDTSVSCGNGVLRIATDAPGVDAFTLRIGKDFTLSTLPVRIGELSESMALPAKRRPHTSEDGSEVLIEQENAIPFGSEPAVKRKIRLSGQLLSVTMDLEMRASSEMKEISAGGLVLEGPVEKIRFLGMPEKGGFIPVFSGERDFASAEEGAVLYDEAYPPFGIVAEGGKSAIDLIVGDDFWRWTNAGRIGGSCRFIVKKTDGALHFLWQLFKLKPDTEMPAGRNWRLTWAASWRLSGRKKARKTPFKSVFSLDCTEWQDASRALLSVKKNAKKRKPSFGLNPVCLCSGSALNLMKKWLRSQLADAEEGDVFAVTDAVPHYCVSAGHMERARFESLPHWDLASLLEFRRWANRQLAPRGATLELIAPEDSVFKGFMTLL